MANPLLAPDEQPRSENKAPVMRGSNIIPSSGKKRVNPLLEGLEEDAAASAVLTPADDAFWTPSPSSDAAFERFLDERVARAESSTRFETKENKDHKIAFFNTLREIPGQREAYGNYRAPGAETVVPTSSLLPSELPGDDGRQEPVVPDGELAARRAQSRKAALESSLDDVVSGRIFGRGADESRPVPDTESLDWRDNIASAWRGILGGEVVEDLARVSGTLSPGAAELRRRDAARDAAFREYMEQELRRSGFEGMSADERIAAMENLVPAAGETLKAGGETFTPEEFGEHLDRYAKDIEHLERFAEDVSYRNDWLLQHTGLTEERYRNKVADELEGRLNEIERKLPRPGGGNSLRGGYAAIGRAMNEKPSSEAPAVREWMTKARDVVNTLRKDSFGSGLREGFDFGNVLTAGFKGLGDNVNLIRVLNAASRGEKLTPSQQALVDAWSTQQEAEDAINMLGGRSLGAGIGAGFSESLEFMTGMLATSGVAGAATAGLRKAATSAAARSAARAVAHEATKKGWKSAISKGLGKGAVRLSESVVGAAVRTPLTGQLYKGYTDKRLGQFSAEERPGDDGLEKTIRKAPRGAWKDALEAYLETAMEYQSEDVGQWIGAGANALSRRVAQSRLGTLMGLKNFSGAKRNAALQWFKENAKITNFAGEVLGEAYGDAMVNLFEGNRQGWREMMTKDYWWTLGGVSALLSGPVGAFGVPAQIHQARVASGLSRLERKALASIENPELKDRMAKIAAMENITQRSRELAKLDWESKEITAADAVHVLDFINARTKLDALQGSETEDRRLTRFIPVLETLDQLQYRGADGKNSTGEMMYAADNSGNSYIVLSGDPASGDMLTVYDPVRNSRLTVPASEIAGWEKKGVSDVIAEEYALMFRVEANQEKLDNLFSRVREAAEAGVSDTALADMLLSEGIHVFKPGDEATLLDGQKVLVEDFSEGDYEVVLENGEKVSVGLNEVLQPDAEAARAQQASAQTQDAGAESSASETVPDEVRQAGVQAEAMAREAVVSVRNADDDIVYTVDVEGSDEPVNILRGASLVYDSQTGAVDVPATLRRAQEQGLPETVAIRYADGKPGMVHISELQTVLEAADSEEVVREARTAAEQQAAAMQQDAAEADEIDKGPFQKKMQNDRVLHLKKSLFDSEGRLTEPRMEGPDLVPTPRTSNGEDTTTIPENQTAEEEIPRQKNGQPDFNAMPADMLAVELLAAVGHDKAVERLQVARGVNAKSMDKLRKSLDGMGDLNKAMAVEQRLAAMQQEDARLSGALEQLDDMAARHAEDDAAPRDAEDLAAVEAYDQERNNSRPEPVIAERPGPDDVPFSVVGGASAAPAGVTPERWNVIVEQLRQVIGAENVVTDPEAVRAAYEQIMGHGMEIRRQQVADINERFNEQLEQLKEGTLASNVRLELGVPGSVLQASGINPSQIYLTQHVLRTHAEKHGLTTDDLRNLPAALENPIMVYEWGDKARSTVVITEIPRGNERIAVAVRLKSGQNGIAVNAVASVHGKSAERLLADMNNGKSDFAQNNLRYVDKKRTLDWLASGSFGLGISDQEFLSATNIITNFENPKIGPENIVPQGEETRYFRTPEGEVYGFTAGGKIYLDSERMNAATPMHEYTELWSQIVARENPAWWHRAKEIMRGDTGRLGEIWQEVNSDPNYRDLGEDLRASETLSRATGEWFARKQAGIRDHENLFTALKRLVREFWRKLKSAFARWSDEELAKMKADDVMGAPLKDFVEGIDLTKYRDEKTLAGVHNISATKLRKALKQGGFANPSAAVIDLEKQSHEGYGEISLILPSSLVDKRTGRNAGTWTADAWTPTYPAVERQISDDGSERFARDLESLPEGMRNKTRMGINSWLDGGDAWRLAYMFLHERGEAPELQIIPARYSAATRDAVNAATQGSFDLYNITPEGSKAVLDAYVGEQFGGDRTAYEQALAGKVARMEGLLNHERAMVRRRAAETLAGIRETGFDYKELNDFARSVGSDARRGGKIDDDATSSAAANYITDKDLQGAFDKWIDGLGDRYGVREVLFNGFTPSGMRRYVPNTLENASKMMTRQGRNGATGMGISFNTFAAGLLDSLGSLKDIRARKGSLTTDHGKVDAFRDKWSEVFFDLGEKCQPDARGYDDYGLYRLAEAARKRDPQSYLKKEYGVELSDEDTARLKEMVKAIRTEFPAMYFETKFERPVYLNEMAGAVVPENTDKDILDALDAAGIPYRTYGAAEERPQVIREFSEELEGVRFNREFTERRVTTLEKLENKRDALLADRENIANFDEQITAVDAEIEAYMQSDPVADTFGKDGAGDAHLQAVEDAVYDMQREINLPTQTVVVRNADEFIARLREMGATDEQLKGISPEHCPEGAQWRGEIVIRGDAVADKVHAQVIYIHEQAHDITEALFTPDELYDAAEEMGADYMNKRLEERNASYHVDGNSVESMIQGANEMISRGVDLLYRKGLLAEFFATENGPIYPVIMYMEEHGVPSRLKDLIVENLQNIKADQYGTERTRQNIPGEVERQLDSRLFPAREGDGTADETGGRTGTAGDAVPERIGAGAAGVAADAGGRIGGRGGDLDRPSFSFGDSGNDAPKLTKQQQLIADVEAAVSDPRNDIATTIRNFMPQVETLREALVEELEGDPAGELLSAFGSAGDRAAAIGALREMRQALLDRDIRRKEEDARRRAERREYHEKVLNLYSRLTETDVEPDKLPQSVTSYIKTLVTPELMEVMGIRDFHSIATDIETALHQDKIQNTFAEYRKQRAHYRDIQQTETDPAVLESERQVMESAARTFADRVLASRPMQRIMDAVADMDLRLAKNRFDDLLRLKVEGLNASGVNTAKSVDENTRVFFKLLRDNLGLTEAQLQAKIEDGGAVSPLANFDGVMLHAMYRACLEEENNIDDLKSRLRKYSRESVRLYHVITGKSKGVSDALREEARANRATARRAIDATRAALVAAKSHLAGNYANLNQHLTSKLETGKTLFSDMEEARKRHQKHLVSEAVKAVKPESGDKGKNADFPEGSRFVKGITSPFASFESTIQTVSINDPGRNGFLTQHFMLGPDGWAEANGQYQQRRSEILNGILAAFDRLVLHKKSDTSDRSLGKRLVERLERPFKETDTDDLFRYFGERLSDRDGNPVILETTSPEGSYYKSRSIVVTRGKALLWIAWGRQSELMPRLENIGLDREKLEILRSLLSKEDLAFLDWIQLELLPELLKERYNPVYRRMFGVDMDSTAWYFPFVANKNMVRQEVDMSQIESDGLPATITGSIIRRRHTMIEPDLDVDLMGVLTNHIGEMEHWAAFAPFISDINTLLSSPTFRNALESQQKGRYSAFKKVCFIAADAYRKFQPDPSEQFLTTLEKTCASAKIAWRGFTALKQVLSGVMFRTYTSDARFQKIVTRHLWDPFVTWKDWTWCMENLPSFRERWESRYAGDERLALKSPSRGRLNQAIFDHRGIQKTRRWFLRSFMYMNALVDAWVCARGARAVYLFEMERLQERGLDAGEADRQAKILAAIAMNTTQQSSEGAYMSVLQSDRTYMSATLSIFNNSSFAFGRIAQQAFKVLTMSKARREEVLEARKRYWIGRDLDETQATTRAREDMRRLMRDARLKLLLAGYLGNLIWNLFPPVMTAFVGGFNRDRDNRDSSYWRTWWNTLRNEVSWSTFVTPVFRNFAGGSQAEGVVNGFDLSLSMALQDYEKLKKEVSDVISDFSPALALHLLGKVGALGLGVDFDTFVNMYKGAHKMFTRHETAAGIFQFLNSPKAILAAAEHSPGRGETDREYMERMAYAEGIAEEEMKRMETAPSYRLDDSNRKVLHKMKKWERNYLAYRQASALEMSWERDKFGNVTIPELKRLDEDYESAVKWMGLTRSGEPVDELKKNWDSLGRQEEELTIDIIGRVHAIYPFERELENNVVFGDEYREQMKALVKLKQEVVALVENNK